MDENIHQLVVRFEEFMKSPKGTDAAPADRARWCRGCTVAGRGDSARSTLAARSGRAARRG